MATQKFKDLVHYICWKCEDPTQLGATKLNKIPWRVDTVAYQIDGESVTGEVYVKRQHGPVPKNILRVLEELKTGKKIVVREPDAEFQPREYVALSKPDMSAFSERHMALIDAVIDEVCKRHTANSISTSTHDQVWDAAAIGEEMPLYATFAAEADEVTKEDMAWADKIVDKLTHSVTT